MLIDFQLSFTTDWKKSNSQHNSVVNHLTPTVVIWVQL